jgi:8-oxo-dGTP pyrophosphatase MutT (NUDIX family)
MIEKIRHVLAGYQRSVLPATGLTEAAVLVPLFFKQGELHFLMCRRTQLVLKHKGQISFPGGAKDAQDQDVTSTALRESWEEVGLESRDVSILGLLDDMRTMTGFHITPVVGVIPYPYDFKVHRVEVEALLEVPWSLFEDGQCHRVEHYEHEGVVHDVDFYDFHGEIIWGATARISRRLIELVGSGSEAT